MTLPAYAQDQVMVGGAPMYSNKTIAENAPNAPNLTTLVAAVKAAGLVDTLAGKGPFTVFAPTNAAFEKLPAGTVDGLLKPEAKKQLTAVLTYHVVAGDYTAEKLMAMVKKDGSATLTTVEGAPITVKMDGDKLVVIDQSGGGAVIQTPDVMQSNGVVHVIGSVLMPKMG
ncbi:fasciclin domain-containing protein [Aurantimonas sp. MSK8Z-1]|nr:MULTISPECIES: fasciclin domain-containing protein [unclassified Aurantimonas]MCQ8783576.1 fasciclin domain-containing protein [Aurantimonas sp. CSK15Z-1]MCW4116464.1 fasciclin domain-containing protein [Aurantimonas sp. MSK8Z-1]